MSNRSLLELLKKGQIVFLDNVSTHKVDGVEEAIEKLAAHRPFSYRLTAPISSIEQLFARNSNRTYRKMKGRTVEQLWRGNRLFSQRGFQRRNAQLISQTRATPN